MCRAGDLAPTAPGAVRTAFATLIPSLAGPCRARPAGRRSTTGADDARRRPRGRILKAVKASNATFKVVVNEVPMQQFYQLPYDRWEGYAAARTRLLKASPGSRTSSS